MRIWDDRAMIAAARLAGSGSGEPPAQGATSGPIFKTNVPDRRPLSSSGGDSAVTRHAVSEATLPPRHRARFHQMVEHIFPQSHTHRACSGPLCGNSTVAQKSRTPAGSVFAMRGSVGRAAVWAADVSSCPETGASLARRRRFVGPVVGPLVSRRPAAAVGGGWSVGRSTWGVPVCNAAGPTAELPPRVVAFARPPTRTRSLPGSEDSVFSRHKAVSGSLLAGTFKC